MGQIVEASGLTGTNLELRFHVNPDTGEVFYKRHSLLNGKRLIRAGFIKPGTQSNGGGYRIISVPLSGGRYKKVRAHHLVWAWMTGGWPDSEIDHKNNDRDDNRFCNLREATVSQNRRNKLVQRNNKSGYKWVYWDKQREMWKVDIRHFSTNGTKNRKVLFHYFHADPLVAYKAACEAAKTIFGEFYNDGCKK